MISLTSLKLEKFHGGLTDHPVDNDIYRFETGDNILLDRDGKPIQRDGSVLWDSTNDRIADAKKITMIALQGGDYLFHVNKNIYYVDTTWQTLVGPVTSNPVLTSGGEESIISWSYWNEHLFITNDDFAPVCKIYDDDSGDKQVRTAGLPDLASAPTCTPTADTSKNFLYRFLYKYTYKVGTVEFIDYGPATEVSVTNADAPQTNQINITAIPALANSTTYNYDTTAIKVEVYRTVHDGTVFYYVGEVTNGTTTFTDNVSDATIINNSTLYTEGGILDNDPPPLCKFLHITNGIGYYGHIKVGTEIFSNRVRQSVKNDVDSCPATMYVDVQNPITALGSYKGRPLVFSKSEHHRIEGAFDELGRGTVNAIPVKNIGTESPNSVVETPYGTFFAGPDGFYVTDGFESYRVSDEFEETYTTLVQTDDQKERIYGAYDKKSKRVWWAVQSSEASASEIDKCFILDLKWGVKPDSCFSTASNGTYWAPTALYFKPNGNMIRADRRGYIFEHSGDYKSDPRIDVDAASSADWDRATIIFSLKTIVSSFGNVMLRKLNPRVNIVLKNVTNLFLQMYSIADVGLKRTIITSILHRTNWVWGDPSFTWGDDEFVWGGSGVIEQQRRLSGSDLRCSFRQFEFTNAYAIITKSDDLCTAVVDSSAKTVTLSDTATYDWPTYLVDYKISFEDDSYDTEFPILTRTNDVITVQDVGGNLPDGTYKWHIKGYAKDQFFHLLALGTEFSYLGKTQNYYSSTQAGENA